MTKQMKTAKEEGLARSDDLAVSLATGDSTW